MVLGFLIKFSFVFMEKGITNSDGGVNLDVLQLAGGELGVENVNLVDNDGVKFNPALNASISTFSPRFLNNFLCYPTVLYNGSITASASVGTDIYVSEVSPTLLKSNALTRIKNFASNFRQWNGSFCLRIIFTKPIFIQTKIIAAFIPGINITDAADLDVYDLYGAQYHSVMNPDNDNELSFVVPFITGLNWLNMEDSTGVVAIKLFQPLIASQPTGVMNVSIPFTILLSSDASQSSSPLNFRFLVAPAFDNPVLKSNAMDTLVNSISPSCNPLKIQPGIVPPTISSANSFKSLVMLPVSSLETYVQQKYSRNTAGVAVPPYGQIAENVTAASLDGSQINIYNENSVAYVAPWVQYEQFNTIEVQPTRVSVSYDNIGVNNPARDTYYVNSSGSNIRLKLVSNLLTSPLGDYKAKGMFIRFIDGTSIFIAVTNLNVSRSENGLYVYYLSGTVGTQVPAFPIELDFSNLPTISYYSGTSSQTTTNMSDMAAAFGNDVPHGSATHALFYSPHNATETNYQLSNGNYSNLVACTADQFSASSNERSLVGYNIAESGYVSGTSITPQLSFAEFFYFIKVAADIVAVVATTVSNLISYLLPTSTINNVAIRSNNFVVIPIGDGEPIFYKTSPDFQKPTFDVSNTRIRVGIVRS